MRFCGTGFTAACVQVPVRLEKRLAAAMAARLHELPAGSLTVVRALPATATSSYDELVADVDGALKRILQHGLDGR